VNQAVPADSVVMLFIASLALAVGGLLVINRRWAAHANAEAVRRLGRIYGERATARLSEGATPKYVLRFGIGMIAFACVSMGVLFFRLHIPIGIPMAVASAVLGLSQVVIGCVFAWCSHQTRRLRPESRGRDARAYRRRTSAVLVGGCGLITLVGLVLLLVIAPL